LHLSPTHIHISCFTQKVGVLVQSPSGFIKTMLTIHIDLVQTVDETTTNTILLNNKYVSSEILAKIEHFVITLDLYGLQIAQMS